MNEHKNHQHEGEELCEAPHHHSGLALDKMKERLPNSLELDRIAELFKVLGDPTRMQILTALFAEQELCVCDISDLLGMSQSAISHQLRLLRATHLVKNRREGKSIYYSLDDTHVATIIAQGLEHIRHND